MSVYFRKFLKVSAAFCVALSLLASQACAEKKIIRLAAVGDIMPGPQAEADFLDALKPYLADRQVVLGNLEGPLTDKGSPAKAIIPGLSYVFRSSPDLAARFAQAGFTAMTLANNHANDYGPEGARQTREVLEQAGLVYTGAPGEIARQKLGDKTIAIIGLAPNKGCQNINDLAAAVQLVRQEAAKPDTLVIATFHGGAEGSNHIYVPDGPEIFLGENRGDLKRLSRALIDAGAHLVIGHGPHVPRGLELYKGRLIAYSLGNFLTGAGLSVDGRKGLAPLLLVDLTWDGRLAGGQVLSFRQDKPGRISLDDKRQAMQLMYALSVWNFQIPALGPEGRLLLSEEEAQLMAEKSPKPKRPALALRSKSLAPAERKASDDKDEKLERKNISAASAAAGKAEPEKEKSEPAAIRHRYEWQKDYY